MKVSNLSVVLRARLLGADVPLSVGFEITHLCNLACDYCDRHTPLPNEMAFEEIIAALAGLKRIGMREISLDGGEPLAHKRVDDVAGWLFDNDIVVRCNTNGILVRRKAEIVKRFTKVKISLDGPPAIHDAARGERAFQRAVEGAKAAADLGVPVEFTCVVGRHNAHAIDELMTVVGETGFPIIFQPARESLFVGQDGPGRDFQLDHEGIQKAFCRVEHYKRSGGPVLNGWSSLRHFRNFPNDAALPCAAGHINVTMDPEGNLYHCGQINRDDKSNNVVRLGVEEAFRRLRREGCAQCWCARVVEENYAWGGRVDKWIPLSRRAGDDGSPAPAPADPNLLPAQSLVRKAGQDEPTSRQSNH
jgi:MoaA/NifB/PqqE/SkfB family radical SAM enzyme